jgi:RNA polymerase sigma factor (sigma-70 family)
MRDGPAFRRLILDLRAGREAAAAEVLEEYSGRLRAVAQRRISAQLGRRIDADDVLQSVFRSLFVRLRRSEFELDGGEDLWKLLVTVTLNKVRSQAAFHSAGRRALAREQRLHAEGPAIEETAAAPGLDPAEAVALADELETFLSSLPDWARPLVELRLQGLTSREIASQTGRAERSVRRFLERVRRRLEERAAHATGATDS